MLACLMILSYCLSTLSIIIRFYFVVFGRQRRWSRWVAKWADVVLNNLHSVLSESAHPPNTRKGRTSGNGYFLCVTVVSLHCALHLVLNTSSRNLFFVFVFVSVFFFLIFLFVFFLSLSYRSFFRGAMHSFHFFSPTDRGPDRQRHAYAGCIVQIEMFNVAPINLIWLYYVRIPWDGYNNPTLHGYSVCGLQRNLFDSNDIGMWWVMHVVKYENSK